MAVVKLQNSCCPRAHLGYKKVTPSQGALLPSQRAWPKNPLCTSSKLPRICQLYTRRTLCVAAPANALLQEWRAPPRLQLRGITAPLVALDDSRSSAAAENAFARRKIDSGREELCECSPGARGAKKAAYCQSEQLPDSWPLPSSLNAGRHWRPPCPASAEVLASSDLEGDLLYREEHIGAGAFVARWGTRRGLQGIIRYRSEDFVVREIGEDGWICEFPSTENCTSPVDQLEGQCRENVTFHPDTALHRPGRQPSSVGPECESALQQTIRQTRQSATHRLTCDNHTLHKKSELAPCLGSAQSSEGKDDHATRTDPTCDPFTESGERLRARSRACEEGYSFKFVLGKRNRETPEALEMISRATGIPLECFSFAGMKDRRAVTLQWVSCRLPRSLCLSNTVGRTPLRTCCRGVAGKGNWLTVITRTNGEGSEKLRQKLRSAEPVIRDPAAKQSPSAVSLSAPSKRDLHAMHDVLFTRVTFLRKHTSVKPPSSIQHAHPAASGAAEKKESGAGSETASIVTDADVTDVSVCADAVDIAADSKALRQTATEMSSLLDGCSIAAGGSRAVCDTASAARQGAVGACTDCLLAFATFKTRSVNPEMSSAYLPLSKDTNGCNALKVVASGPLCLASTVTRAVEGRTGGTTQAGADPVLLRPSTSPVAIRGVKAGISKVPEEVETSEGSHTLAKSDVAESSPGSVKEDYGAYLTASGDRIESSDSVRGERSILKYGSNPSASTQDVESTAELPEQACLSVVQMTNFAEQAMAHPSWDPCVSWGRFRRGHVYLGGLKGNNFTILLRNLQLTACVNHRAVSRGEIEEPLCSSETSCVTGNVRTPQRAVKRDTVNTGGHAGAWRMQVSAHGEETDSASPPLHRKVDAAGIRGCTDKEDGFMGTPRNEGLGDDCAALREELRGAATVITEKGFVNYFGPQRFGTGVRPTFHIGRALLRRQHNLACHLIMQIPANKFCEPTRTDGENSATPSPTSRPAQCGISSILESVSTDAAQTKGVHGEGSFTGMQEAAIFQERSTVSPFDSKKSWGSAAPSDHQRAYAAAQDAYWHGDFWRAYTLLPKSCRLERQLLRQLAGSPYVQNASWRTCHEHEVGDTRGVKAGGEEIHSCQHDITECVNAVELAAAAGAATEGASRRLTLLTERKVAGSSSSLISKGAVQATTAIGTEKSVAAEMNGARRMTSNRGEEGRGEDSFSRVGGAALAPRDAVRRAIAGLPRLQRLMYVKAYAAYLWNKCATERVRLYGADRAVPGDLVLMPEKGSSGTTTHQRYEEIGLPRQSAGVPRSYTFSRCPSKGGDTNSRVRVLTKEDCTLFRARDVVLPLIGVGAVLPRNAVGDYMVSLLEKEGLPESLYQRDSEYFLDVVYRPLLSRPRDFVCELLRLPPDFPGVVPDNFPKSQLRDPITSNSGSNSISRHSGLGKVDKHAIPDSATRQSASTQDACGKINKRTLEADANVKSSLQNISDPIIIWSFGGTGVAGSGSGDKDLQVSAGKSSHSGGRAAEPTSFSRTASNEGISNSDEGAAERKTSARCEHGRDAAVTGVDFRGGVVKKRRAQWRSSSVNGVADSGNMHSKSHESWYHVRRDTEPQQGRLGLLLRFTLDAGVFASSALREFMHCPFLHPFAQRRREKRNLPERVKVMG